MPNKIDTEQLLKNDSMRKRRMMSEDVHTDRYEDGRKYYAELQPHFNQNVYREAEFKPEIPQWPLTPQQFKEVERQVLQNPEWLAFWAKFEWRSWMSPSNWYYNPHTDIFSFYDVPQISYIHGKVGPDRGILQIKSNGEIDHSKRGEYADYFAFLPSCIDVCINKVREASPKMKYLKGSYYIRFGMWPQNERSRNWLVRDRVELEKGVSVYHASYDLEGDRWAIDASVDEAAISGTMQSLIYGSRPIFLVQGTELKNDGADGEPLLHNVKLIKQLNKKEVYCPGIFDPAEDEEDY